MPNEVLRDREAYTIVTDDEIGAIVHTWDEYVSGEDFREGCEELLDVIRQENRSKLLVDTSGITAHDDEDKAWLQEEWVPRIADAGIEYSANVHPESVIAKMELENLHEGMDRGGSTAMMTDDTEEGRDWLATR